MTKSEHERLSAYKYDPRKLIIVGIDVEDTPELHHLYDPSVHNPLSDEWVKQIDAEGVHTPIRTTGIGDELYVVVGRKRVLGTRLANDRREKDGEELRIVPGVRVEGTPAELLKMVVSENAQRSNLGPLDRAALMQRLFDAGIEEEEVRTTLGVTGQTIKNWKALLSVSPAVRKVFEKGKLPATALMKVASLPASEQKAALTEAMAAEGSPVQAAARAARKSKAKKAPKGKKKKKADVEGYPPPGKRTLIRVLESEGAEELLGTDGLNVLKWVLGRVGPSKFAGLQKVINEGSAKAE